MKKFEYKVFNLSEAAHINKVNGKRGLPPVSWIDVLNERGKEGWEYTGTQPTSQSFLLKREVDDGKCIY